MTSDPRVPLLPLDQARRQAAEHGMPEYMTSLSIFRALLHQPKFAARLSRMLGGLLFEGRLDPRLRELVIMRLGWTTGAVYEWTQHWHVSASLGIDPQDVLATRVGPDDPRFGSAERAVLSAVDEMVSGHAVSASTWQEIRMHLSDDPAVLVELLGVIATWHAVSFLLRSIEIPLEEGLSPWPPDGSEPELK